MNIISIGFDRFRYDLHVVKGSLIGLGTSSVNHVCPALLERINNMCIISATRGLYFNAKEKNPKNTFGDWEPFFKGWHDTRYQNPGVVNEDWRDHGACCLNSHLLAASGDLAKQVSYLKGQVADLKGDSNDAKVEGLNSTVAELKTKVEHQAQQLAKFEKNVHFLLAASGDLAKQVSYLKGQVADLKGDSNDAKVEGLISTVAELKTKVEHQAQQLAKFEKNVPGSSAANLERTKRFDFLGSLILGISEPAPKNILACGACDKSNLNQVCYQGKSPTGTFNVCNSKNALVECSDQVYTNTLAVDLIPFHSAITGICDLVTDDDKHKEKEKKSLCYCTFAKQYF